MGVHYSRPKNIILSPKFLSNITHTTRGQLELS